LLRKLALLASACTLLFVATIATAQQVDLTVGGSTVWSPSPNPNLVNFQPPALKNGTYASIGGDFIGFRGRRLGLNFETAWRYKQATYPFTGETYRPFFSDVDALYQSRIGKKLRLDLMAGIGIATTRFNVPPALSCSTAAGGCINYTNSNHFMEDLGVGVRYYFWRRFFVRPEVRYYHIENNIEFNSSNVFRGGASIGYTFHTK
jgi:hypothetical protein